MNNQKNKVLALMLGFVLLGGMANPVLAMEKKRAEKRKPMLSLEQQAVIAGNNMIAAIRTQRFPSEYAEENIDYVRDIVKNFKNREVLVKGLQNLETWLDMTLGGGRSGKSLKTEKSFNHAFTLFKIKMFELYNKAHGK